MGKLADFIELSPDEPILNKLERIRLCPVLTRQVVLRMVCQVSGLENVDYSLPCTLFRLRLHGNSGTIQEAQHVGLLSRMIEGSIFGISTRSKKEWKKKVNDSPLKPVLVDKSIDNGIGYATREELVSDDLWFSSDMGTLAEKVGALGLGYFWFRVSDVELWVIGIRKLDSREVVNPRGVEEGICFLDSLKQDVHKWHRPAAASLTSAYQLAVHLKVAFPDRKNASLGTVLGISEKAFNKRLHDARSELQKVFGEQIQMLSQNEGIEQLIKVLDEKGLWNSFYYPAKKVLEPTGREVKLINSLAKAIIRSGVT